MIDRKFIDDMKNSIDFIEFAKRYTDLKLVGNQYVGKCPNPYHDDKNPSFAIYKSKTNDKYEYWRCFGCHKGDGDLVNSKENKGEDIKYRVYSNDIIGFYMWVTDNTNHYNYAHNKIENYTEISWFNAVKHLCEEYGIAFNNSYDNEFYRLYRKYKIMNECYLENLYHNNHLTAYLHDRGLTNDSIKKWQIGISGNRYGPKITFPLLDRQSKVVGFSQRWIDKPEWAKDKYRNTCTTKIFNKSTFLYGLHNIDYRFKELRITEGAMDVIMADQFKAKNVVATLGTSITEQHIKIIQSLDMIPVFILDGDEAGTKALKRVINKVNDAGMYCKILFLPEGYDLCDISLEEKDDIEEYIRTNSVTYGSYLLENINSWYQSELNEINMLYKKKAYEILKKAPSIEQEILKSNIEERIKVI